MQRQQRQIEQQVLIFCLTFNVEAHEVVVVAAAAAARAGRLEVIGATLPPD